MNTFETSKDLSDPEKKVHAEQVQLTEDRETGRPDHNEFISEMIRNVSDKTDPDDILNEILRFIGEGLHSDRAYIFELDQNGNCDNTYEWCREGVSAEIDNLQDIPFEGLMEIWFDAFKKEHRIIIRDLEEYRDVSRPIYEILEPQGIKTLVTGPISIGGEMIGFYGVDNPPVSSLENISYLFNMMEFVFTMMINLRNNINMVEKAASHDALTGCYNRKALEWIYEDDLERDQPVAVLHCDLNGLKRVNDLQGHDAGDEFLKRTSEALCRVFGNEHVYRMGGDEFLVILTGGDTEGLDDKVKELRSSLGDTISLGVVARDSIDEPMDILIKEADMKMYAEKQVYYIRHPEMKYGRHAIREYMDSIVVEEE